MCILQVSGFPWTVILLFFTGLDDLVVQLDKTMLKVTGRLSIVVRVLMGGEEVR